MPLNKFIAHAGVAARREAAEIVKKGLVKVNGVVVIEPGHKVSSRFVQLGRSCRTRARMNPRAKIPSLLKQAP